MRCARDIILAVIVAAACDDGSASDEGGTDASSDGGSSDESTGETSDPAMWSSLEERPCPEDSSLTWENFGGGYVLSYCTTCHHSALPADMRQLAPIAINFETIEMIRMHAPRMWIRGADQNMTMPPVGAPGADERALLGEWLACGAPTNADLGMD